MQSLNSPYQTCNTTGAFELGFCSIVILSESTAEIVITEGVDVSGKMVAQCVNLLRATLIAPFCLLVNESNSHSYDFQAQTALGAIDDVLAVALVCDKPPTKMAACCLMQLPRPTDWPMAVFSDRDEAMAMLEEQQRGIETATGTVEQLPRALGVS